MRRVVVPFLIALSLAGCAGVHGRPDTRLDEPFTEENARIPRGLQNAIDGVWGIWPPPLQ